MTRLTRGAGLMWTALLAMALDGSAAPLLRETFDTPVTSNRDLFDTRFSVHTIHNGSLVLIYSAMPNSPPNGIECWLPPSVVDIDERVIEMNLLGCGFEMSNSLFISYALADGGGLAFPPLPYGAKSNSYRGARNGYVLRLLRHGDGTNEMIFYRMDTGWIEMLGNAWLPANPVHAIRKISIRHGIGGRHRITATFDTGVWFDRTAVFEDSTYPPGNAHSGIQFIAKAHAPMAAALEAPTDTWLVFDIPAVGPRPRKKTPAAAAPAPTPAAEPQSADALDLLGSADISREKYASAYRRLSRALAIRRETYGPDHLKVAESLMHLADLYRSNDLSESERLYKSAIAMREKLTGKRSPAVAAAVEGLAGLYQFMRRMDEAETLFLSALKMREDALGKTHPEVAGARYRLGLFHEQLLDTRKAEKYFKQSLDIREKLFGPEHPAVVESLTALTRNYMTNLEDTKAEPLVTRLAAYREKTLGPDHPDVGESLHMLADFRMGMGRKTGVESLLKRALSIFEKSLGPNHPRTSVCLYSLGTFYAENGRFAEALPLLERTMDIYMQDAFEDRSEVFAQLSYNLATICFRDGRLDRAEALYRRSLSMRIAKFGMNDPKVAEVMDKLGLLCETLGRLKEAEDFFNRALAIKAKTLGSSHREVADTLNHLGRFYEHQGLNEKAEPMYAGAATVLTKLLGPAHPDTRRATESIARIRKAGYKRAK